MPKAVKGVFLHNWLKEKNEKHKQGEIRDKLGPSDREENPTPSSEDQITEQNVESLSIRAIQGDSGDAIKPKHFTQKILAQGCASKKEVLHVEDAIKNRGPQAVYFTLVNPLVRIPIEYSRLSSTSSLTATRSTLQIWSVRKKKNSSSSRLPTVASSASTLGHTTVRSSTGCARERQFQRRRNDRFAEMSSPEWWQTEIHWYHDLSLRRRNKRT